MKMHPPYPALHMKKSMRVSAMFALLAVSACGVHTPPLHQKPTRPNTAVHSSSQQHSSRQMKSLDNLSPGFLFLAADKALKDGNHALAIQFLEALVKKDPQAIDPHIQLTRLLLEFGQSEKAAIHLNALLAAPGLTPAQRQQLQLARIRLYLEQGQTDKALQATNSFLKTHPTHIMGRNIQAKILAREKRYNEALTAIAAAIRIKELPEFRLLQAQLLIKSGDLITAKKALLRMQQLAPDDEAPVLLLSTLAIKRNHADKATKLLRAFIAKHPGALRANLALGRLLIQQKQLFDAIMVYRHIAEISGGNPAVLRQLGLLYFQNKDYAEAEKTFLRLLAAHPDDMSRFYLAASLEAQGKSAEAEKLYALIDHASAMAIEAQVRLAAIEINHDELEKASRRLQQVIKEKPGHLDAHLMLSSIRLNQKQYQKLLDETAALVSINKLPPQILFNRAVAFEHFKRYEQSDAMLNRIIKRDPNHSEALNFLGYSYAMRGIHLNRARVLIQRALIQKPNDGYYLDSLAWAYYKSGNYAKAARTQRLALKQVPDDAVMHEHYGDILWRNGDLKGARKAWQQAIDMKSEHPELLRQKIASGLKPTE